MKSGSEKRGPHSSTKKFIAQEYDYETESFKFALIMIQLFNSNFDYGARHIKSICQVVLIMVYIMHP